MSDGNPPHHEGSLPKGMGSYIHQSLAKAQRAVEIADELFALCHAHASSEDPRLLTRAGALVGDFANNLRSALNYTARAIFRRDLLPVLSASRRKKVSRDLDFPWAMSLQKFDAKPVCQAMKELAGPLYKRVRRFQPFHPGNEWLGHLMTLSNTDKHVVLNNVLAPTASAFVAFLPDGSQLREPWFVGDKLVILAKDGPVAAELPYYYVPMRAFATPRKTWNLYMVPIVEGFSLDLVEYTRTTPLRVVRILAALEALTDAHDQDPAT